MRIKQAVDSLKKGGVIAYPTEAVFGLGCDPFNQAAVMRLLQLKNREVAKGLILIASDLNQVSALIKPLPIAQETQITSAKTPTTWVCPATEKVPAWILGNHETLAVRIIEHPVAKALCEAFGGPIVSTSANRSGEAPLQDAAGVKMLWADQIDYVLEGCLGGTKTVSAIVDVMTGVKFR